jgi:Clostripain family
MANEKWTIMVYMAGDNNLADEMISSLQSVENTHIAEGITWRVLFDSGGPLKQKTIVGSGTQPMMLRNKHRRLKLEEFKVFRKKSQPPAALGVQPEPEKSEEVKSQRVRNILQVGVQPEPEKFEEVNPRIRDILQVFVRDTVIKNPADHYVLILSGHGSGAVGDFLGSNRQSANLSIRDIGQVLTNVGGDLKANGVQYQGIDVLGLDSCLMGMAEVAYEVEGSVRFHVVGAEGTEPENGWPYGRILRALTDLANNSKLNPTSLANTIVDQYVENYMDYTDADISTDLTALDVQPLGRMKKELNDLSAFLRQGLDYPNVKDAIVLAHWEAQGYKNEQYLDLFDFCKCLFNRCIRITPFPKEVVQGCIRVMKAIKGTDQDLDVTLNAMVDEALKSAITDKAADLKAVVGTAIVKAKEDGLVHSLVVNSCYTGAAFQHSHGISVFFPWTDMKDAGGTRDLAHYEKLKFAQYNEWKGFLEDYVKKTQRRVRFGKYGEADPSKASEDSRLNYRRGLFSGDPARGDSSHEQIDPDTREDPAAGTQSLETNSAKIASMKNPAVRWSPCKP